MKIKSRKKKAVRIEMLPLIDIVFLLLIFFIYTMLSMAVHRGLELDLPHSSQAAITTTESLSVFLQASQNQTARLFLDDQPITRQKLLAVLQDHHTRSAPVSVLVFADEQTSYQELFGVLDIIQQAGVTEISLQAHAP